MQKVGIEKFNYFKNYFYTKSNEHSNMAIFFASYNDSYLFSLFKKLITDLLLTFAEIIVIYISIYL